MEQESEEYTHSYLQESPLMSDPHILPEESLTQNIPEPFLENTEQNIQEEAEEEEALDRVETPVQPQNSPQKKIESDVAFNISCTKYKVVREVGEGLFQWNLSTDPQSDWDVAWVDTSPDAITFSRIRSHQTINFFPGIQCVARKDQLSTNLKRLKRKFHENYNFFPDTYILPSEYNELRVQFMKDRKNKKIFIMKPQASCQGRGIFLTDNIKNISNTDKYVAQRYLSKPYLLDGLKFDLRIYVLLTSCNPLQIYLFEDGLARFATETYKSPDNNNLSDLFMHLTNYAINKDSPNFIFNASASDPNIGHKRSIKALFKVLEERGHDVKELWEEIKRIVIKTFISVQPNLKQNYKSHLFTRNRTDACFQVFGIDVIIDDAFKPWLLEVNASPSFTTDTPLDKNIKERAISDALRIMNITADSRLRRKAKTEADVIEVQRIGETKEGQNSAWFGGYEKIFPLDDPEQYAENYDAFLGEVNHFWNLALGINEKRDKQIKRNYDYRAITAGNFYPKRDSFKARFESPTPEVKSSNVTDRSEVQSRGDGGKRKKQKVVDTPPVKFFDIRTPIISPSNQSYFAKQNAPHYLSKRSNRPPLAPKEESNQPSIILESKTPQMPTPSTAAVITEKDTNSSTLHTFTIEHSHPYPAQPVLTQPKETTTTTRALPPKPKPVQRDLNTLFQKSAENFSKINTSEIKKEYKEYKQAVKKNPQTGLSKNSRTSASARESVNGLLEKSVEIPRKRTAPKVPKNSFTVFSATPQRTSVVEDPELSKNELPKRFAQQIFRSQAFLENSPLKTISRDKNAIVTQIASEKSKTRSSTSTQRPNSSKAKVESHNPIYSNLVKGTDSSYQHLTPKLSNFMMPKLIESLSNLSLKKVAVASPGVKEKSFTGGDSKIVGMKVSNQAHLNYVSQTKA